MQGFREGYAFFQKSTGDYAASSYGAEYVDSVNSEIDTLVRDLNAFEGFKTESSKLQGDIAEFWHADSFNINATLRGSSHRAFVDRSHDFASPDISTNFGDKYGLKYYKDGVASAKAQAKSVFERFKEYQSHGGPDSLDKFLEDRGYSDIDSVLNDPIYTGQLRLIPSGQLKSAEEWLRKRIEKEATIRPEQVKRYEETLKLLRDKIRDNEGTESIQLTREDAQKFAELAKQGKATAEKLNITTEDLVTYEYILQQAFKAGTTAATISVVLKLAPEVIKAIQYLIETGEINEDRFKAIGFAAVSGAAEGFIRGTVSAGITAACKAGLWGEAAKTINPSAVGMAVVLVMDTTKNAIRVANGTMSRRQMADDLVRETFIASMSLLCGSLVQSILPALPALGFMLGSFTGSVLGGFIFTGVYNKAISFCIETGFTMFGIVKQDYKLPDDVLNEIGFEVYEPTKYKPTRYVQTRYKPTRYNPSRIEFSTIRPFFLSRGVIGIREIGYMS